MSVYVVERWVGVWLGAGKARLARTLRSTPSDSDVSRQLFQQARRARRPSRSQRFGFQHRHSDGRAMQRGGQTVCKDRSAPGAPPANVQPSRPGRPAG